MNVLIIGGGGREHALAWKLKQSPKVKELFVAPGNAGTASVATNVNIKKKEEIVNWLKSNPMDLVVVGPDNYLEEGIVNDLHSLHIKVFGPTREASEIEWSKAFAKEFMQKEGIPTARYQIFTHADMAKAYVSNQAFPIVIKASGLAFGKGVIIATTKEEAFVAIDDIMRRKIFGDAGDDVVIEEYLTGTEVSIHAFCDGEHTRMFPVSQDRKRIYEGDTGPNTGGMGTIAPVSNISIDQLKEIEETIIKPTIRGLKRMGRPFKGVLFPGIMLTKDGPRVIEFNARFGDPETQSYMRILESDLLEILLACVDGVLDEKKVLWSDKSACCIVLASKGYPGSYEKGKTIVGMEDVISSEVQVFQAGTKIEGQDVITNGGRVLGVSGVGSSLNEALEMAYIATDEINFDGKQYRKDIGSF